MELEYNTQREKLIISEYGRHVQKMVDHAASTKNKVERQKMAEGIIDLMGELNPHLRDVDDFKHKLWDHLFIMSDFNIEVDSPFAKPEAEKLFEKPKPLAYPSGKIKFNHYGKVIEMMIEEVCKMTDNELKEKLTVAIANQMKKSYVNWNRDSVEDKLIIKQLEKLSNGQLTLAAETELANVIVQKKNNTHRKKKQNNKHRNKRY